MLYKQFKELKLSSLGFGTMRLPLIPGGGEQDIDQETLDRMVDCAVSGGVNYFDTAYPYHGGCPSLPSASPSRATRGRVSILPISSPDIRSSRA